MMYTLGSVDQNLVPVIAIAGGLVVGLVAIVMGCITTMVRARAREVTAREVAAYVAEGSMTPDEAEKLLQASKPN